MNISDYKTKAKRVLIPGDLHLPETDWRAVALMMEAAKGSGVDELSLIGDNFDGAHFSRHGHGPGSFREDNKAMERLVAMAKRANISPGFALLGNHEAWLDSYIQENPGLAREDLHPSLYGHFEVVRSGWAVQLNKLVVSHGDNVNGSLTVNPGASIARKYPGVNILCGHNHRVSTHLSTHWTPRKQVSTGVWTIGAMVSRDYEYNHPALRQNSQKHDLGFAVVSLFGDELFSVSMGTYVEHNGKLKLLFEGGLYV